MFEPQDEIDMVEVERTLCNNMQGKGCEMHVNQNASVPNVRKRVK